MVRIIGNIFISPLAQLETELEKLKITHVLSVLPGDLPELKQYTHLQIPINDDLETNILAILPQAFEFLNSCLYDTDEISPKSPHKGSVVVHCHEGLSRAPTVVIAYLMKYYKLSLTQATYAVERKINPLYINESFKKQLQVFEQCKGDLSSDIYKQFLVEFNGDAKEALSQFQQTANPSDSNKDEVNGILRCKICREVLAKSTQILSHVKPDESSRHSMFHKKMGNYIYSSTKASVNCSHYFLKDPLKWMELPEDELEGKFHCMKCKSKIGGYSWKGSRCSCGSWIVPSFNLQTAKVDYIKK